MNDLFGIGHFHGHLDDAFLTRMKRALEGKHIETERLVTREVSYTISPHFHPYVGQLIQRLIRRGTSELQAADTEYAPSGASLPSGVELALTSETPLTVPRGSSVALLSDLSATLPGGAALDLAATMQVELATNTSAPLSSAARAVLIRSLGDTPSPDTLLELTRNTEAFLSDDAALVLARNTRIKLYDGTEVTLEEQTPVLLPKGALCTIPTGTQTTVLKSQRRPVLYEEVFSTIRYNPSELVKRPHPVKDLDFTSGGAYAVYNWELFFHVPLMIALHLSKAQRFAEAQQWLHHLFDPTDDSDGPTPERFWKVRPFHTTDVKKIEQILVNLVTGEDETLRDETVLSIREWLKAPFRPHVIARYRQQAYMHKTVMAYLDNLIAWGDALFRQDTGEAIDEALMLYILAANILGPRPQPVPKKGTMRPQTYANLRRDLREFGAVQRDMEAEIPFDLMPYPTDAEPRDDQLAVVRSLGQALYFCIPRNDKLLSYWDTVADRLFKIRNSLNFQGIFRQLALFAPPIDPALLARAAAAGLDVGAIVNGLNQPLPLVRFQFLSQRATELAQEVKSLGNSLLAAMEKEDGERLALLRAKHERVVLEMVEHVRYSQLQEAIKSKTGLLSSLALAVQRYTYYERQLGRTVEEIEESIPELDELDKDNLDSMKFAMEEAQLALRDIETDIAQDLDASGGKLMSSHEATEMRFLELARAYSESASTYDLLGSAISLIPEFGAQAQPMGAGAALKFGGMALAKQMSMAASSERVLGDRMTYEAGKASRIGTYARREQDWAFQSNLAAGEINQIFKQLRAAQIRERIAELELKNHRQQIKHASEIEHFLNEEGTERTGKRTNKALYTWMKREVNGLYAQCFQLAFDTARKAERALQHELGDPRLSYLQFGYLAGKEGLLAGEKLHLDIKRMEIAYHDLNQREYELTKHVSLLQVAPMALLQLRTTGRCTVQLPESLFDMDGPGHYFRRIKTVAVSIPCVAGPYASVNCTLTLLKSSIRKTSGLQDGAYARENAEDARFDDYFGSLQSIVTSSAQNDSGLFETNLRDERYLPFENSGAISEWRLQLPSNPSAGEPSQFDYNTISDVILHIRYTAREGGALLRRGAIEHFTRLIEDTLVAGSVRLFSVRHEFPNSWAAFQNQTLNTNGHRELILNLRPEHYPIWSQGRSGRVERVDILARGDEVNVFNQDDDQRAATLTRNEQLGLLFGELGEGALPTNPVGELKLFFEDNPLTDLWLALAVQWMRGT